MPTKPFGRLWRTTIYFVFFTQGCSCIRERMRLWTLFYQLSENIADICSVTVRLQKELMPEFVNRCSCTVHPPRKRKFRNSKLFRKQNWRSLQGPEWYTSHGMLGFPKWTEKTTKSSNTSAKRRYHLFLSFFDLLLSKMKSYSNNVITLTSLNVSNQSAVNFQNLTFLHIPFRWWQTLQICFVSKTWTNLYQKLRWLPSWHLRLS